MTIIAGGASCLANAPKGKLVYCSYACTGAAGLGKDYCELIADPGQTPRVVVALNVGNRFDDPETHAEYPVGEDVVDSLSRMLAEAKVYKLNGYNVDEPITGGYSYRIYQEYDSGDKVDARWYGHKIKSSALAAYNMIEAFFRPWRTQAIRESDAPVAIDIVVRRPGDEKVDHFSLLARNKYQPRVIYDLNAGGHKKKEVHKQFDIKSEEDMQKLQKLQDDLISLGTISLGDYDIDDNPRGGTIYAVEISYGSGARQKLHWQGDDADPQVQAVYDRMMEFFRQWQPL